MKPKTRILTLGGIVAALVAATTMLEFNGESISSKIAKKAKAGGAGKQRVVTSEVAKDPRILSISNNLSRKALENFIARNNRSASSVSLAYLLSFDPHLLAELKQHKDSTIGAELLASQNESPAERLYWAERLCELQPNNGVGKLLLARSYSEMGKHDEAVTALMEAASAPEMKSNLGMVHSDLKQLLGEVPETDRVSLAFGEINTASLASQRGLLDSKSYGHYFSGKSKEDAIEIAKSYLHILEQFKSNSSLSLLSGQLDQASSALDTHAHMVLSELDKVHPRASSAFTTEKQEDRLQQIVDRSRNYRAWCLGLSPSDADDLTRTAIKDL